MAPARGRPREDDYGITKAGDPLADLFSKAENRALMTAKNVPRLWRLSVAFRRRYQPQFPIHRALGANLQTRWSCRSIGTVGNRNRNSITRIFLQSHQSQHRQMRSSTFSNKRANGQLFFPDVYYRLQIQRIRIPPRLPGPSATVASLRLSAMSPS